MQVSREMTLGIGVSEKASFFVIMIIRASGHELCKSETFCFRMTMSAIYSPKMLSNPRPALLPSPLSHDLQTRCAAPCRRRGAARRYSLWSNLSYPTTSSFDLTRIFFLLQINTQKNLKALLLRFNGNSARFCAFCPSSYLLTAYWSSRHSRLSSIYYISFVEA